MPKGKKKDAQTRVEKSTFRVVYQYTKTTSGTSFNQINLVASNLGDRASFIAENFEFFRVTRLRIYQFCDTVTIGGSGATVGGGVVHGIGFMNTPSGSQTAPTDFAKFSQQEHFKLGGIMHQLSMNVRKGDLLAEPMKWYNTYTTGSVPASTLSAGVITSSFTLTSSGTLNTVTLTLVAEGEVEYHTPIDSTDSFHMRIPHELRDEPSVAKALTRLTEAVADAAETETSSSSSRR